MSANGAERRRQARGREPAVVLLHGWALNAAVWEPLLPHLARCRVITPDLPGHGQCPPVPSFTLDALVDAVRETAGGPAVWLGWSLGAAVALALALRHPEVVDRLVVIGATPRFIQSADWPHGMPAEVFDTFARELSADYARTLQRFLSLQAGAHADRSLLRDLRERLLVGGRPTAQALSGGLDVLRATDLRPRLGAVRAPTLVIHGQRDRLVAPAAARSLADALPASSLRMFEVAGHAPFLSHTAAVAERVLEFIHE